MFKKSKKNKTEVKNKCRPKLLFLTKISISDQNFCFWPKFRCLTKTSVFDQNLDFRRKKNKSKFKIRKKNPQLDILSWIATQ